MAIDEAMLLAHSKGLTPPTLRLYRWQPPTVSLGLLQQYETVNEEICRKLGFDLVRRPSGGGAVLHQHEITYAVVVDGHLCPYGSSVVATYRWIATALIVGLKELGAETSLPASPQFVSSSSANFCFVRLTNADLSISGRKLGGSAQARKRNFILQHGSIPLRLDKDTLRLIFGDVDFEQFTCLEWVLGRSVPFDEFSEALVQGFEKAIGVNFSVGGLTKEELKLASLLVELKYGTESWTKERKAKPELAQQLKEVFERATSQNLRNG